MDIYYMPVEGVGFGSTAIKVANDIDAEFRLNSKVSAIDYEDDDVLITYEQDGMMKGVTARTALVTVSLGVLEAGSISFTPELPSSKQDAIDNMGYGTLNKAVLHWNDDDAIIWPNDMYWFEVITPEDRMSGLYTTFFNPTKLKVHPVSLDGLQVMRQWPWKTRA